MRNLINSYIENISPELCKISDEIFDNPEMGFKEFKACTLLCDWLEKRGFLVERGVGSLETAFRAVYERGNGGPSIGLLAEYDALLMGHACGHHMQGPVMLAVADALKNSTLDKPFKLVVYGTPAEEGPAGKLIMIEKGCFKDIDTALMIHAAPNTTVDIKSLAGSQLKVIYHGVAAHASLTPELTRSALDGLIVGFQGIEFLRGHVKDDVKFYAAINDCEGMPGNTDQTVAKGQISIRTYQSYDIPLLEKRVQDVFKGAALMTGTKVEIQKVSEYAGKLPSYSLNEVIMNNARRMNAPQMIPFREKTGSTDFAFITHMMPAACLRIPFVPEGTSSHSQAFLDAGKTERAHQAIVLGAQILAGTCIDLICDEALLEAAKEEYRKSKAEFEALATKNAEIE